MFALSPNEIVLTHINDGLTLFLHSPSLQVYPLKDKNLIDFLSKYKIYGYHKTQESYNDDDFSILYNFITEKIQETYKPINSEKIDTSINTFASVVLPISGSCNLSCPYCFAQINGKFNFDNFNLDDVEKVIDFIVTQNKDIETNIIFFGGEPFLNLSIIKHTIKVFKDKHPYFHVNYSLTTNGTIINDEIINIIRDNNILILISLDGPDNEFNLRKFKNGSSSFKITLRNIELLCRNHIPVELRATFVSSNPYLLETYQFFEDLQIPFNIVFAYVSENKDHDELNNYDHNILRNIEKQFDKVLLYYQDRIKDGLVIFNTAIKHTFDIIRYKQKREIVCGGGIYYFTILANGDIFSCPHLMNDTKYRIGNINKADICKEELIPTDVNTIKDCDDCWAKFLCLGGCFAQKLSMGKATNQAMNSNECDLERIKWMFYLKIYYYITIVNRNCFETQVINQ